MISDTEYLGGIYRLDHPAPYIKDVGRRAYGTLITFVPSPIVIA